MIRNLRSIRIAALAATVAMVGTLLTTLLPAGAPLAPPSASAQVAAGLDIAVRPAVLDPNPVPGGGVLGQVQPIGLQNWRVRAMVQIGQRIYVGGAFTQVRERPYANAAVFDQRFLAAFDLDTNNWVSTFRPSFDGPVWSLAATADGRLIVGGQFTTVNGEGRLGIAALDATTGATLASFQATIANDGNIYPPSVRGLEVVGDQLYIVGDFNRLVNGASRNGVYSAARVSASTGAWDRTWLPRATGGAVFDIAVDNARSKVHLVGNFTGVNASTGTRGGAVVTLSSGVTVANHEFSQNGSGFQTFGVALTGNQVWLGGEQHLLQVRDATTYAFQGCFLTGYTGVFPSNCTAQGFFGGAGAGGDFQVVEAIDGFVLGGCHCRGNHFNNFTGQETNLQDRGLRAYNLDGTELPFFPNTIYWNEGPYAAMGDTNGCLYVGGDLTGNVDGFARFCQPVSPPRGLNAAANGNTVALSWQRPAVVGTGIARYEVLRDGVVIGQPTTTSFNDATAVAGTTYTYAVRAVGTGGYTSESSVSVTFTVAAADVTPPSIPQSVTAAVNGAAPSVTLGWAASTDNVAVRGYLVHRNFQFRAWVPAGTTFTDTTVVSGQTYRYEIRAQDTSGNNSAPSTPVNATVTPDGLPDTTPPSTPPNVTAAVNAVTPSVTLNWGAATDNVGVRGYLVHRDFQFRAWVPAGTTFTDTTVVAGQTYRYQIRAQDAAGNNSPPSSPLVVIVQ